MRDRVLFCFLFVLLLFTLNSTFGADLASADRHTAIDDSSSPTPTAHQKRLPSMDDGRRGSGRME